MVAILKQITNHVCRDFLLLEGGTLILYIGDIINVKPFQTVYRLWIDCAWRLQNSERILIGSLNDSEIILKLMQIVICKSISAINATQYGDLSVEFEGGYSVRTFSYSTQDDIWELRRTDGYRFGIGAGLIQYEKFEQPD